MFLNRIAVHILFVIVIQPMALSLERSFLHALSDWTQIWRDYRKFSQDHDAVRKISVPLLVKP